jgi:hypothetical protein
MSRPRTLQSEADIQAFVDGLFRRWPALVGFSIPDAGELALGELETQPWNPLPGEILVEVADALLEFLDEEPEALELLRGRTFARVLH